MSSVGLGSGGRVGEHHRPVPLANAVSSLFSEQHAQRQPRASPMQIGISDYLLNAAVSWPDHAAVVDDERRLSYAQLLARACELGARIASAAPRPRTPVCVLMPKGCRGDMKSSEAPTSSRMPPSVRPRKSGASTPTARHCRTNRRAMRSTPPGSKLCRNVRTRMVRSDQRNARSDASWPAARQPYRCSP